MLSVALATLRARWVSFAGAFLTLALGSGFVAIMLMTLTATSGIPFPGPQRFAAAPIVVVPHKTERFTADGFPFSLPVQQPGGLPAPVVKRLASTGRTVPDHTFPAQQAGGPPGQVGHAWSAASFTPYRLVAGHPPATASEVVVGGGSPALVGHRVQVTTAEGTSTYTVAGVTAARLVRARDLLHRRRSGPHLPADRRGRCLRAARRRPPGRRPRRCASAHRRRKEAGGSRSKRWSRPAFRH